MHALISRRLTLLPLLLSCTPVTLAAPPEPAVQPDAVIELWEQDWTLNADGSSVRHEKQHVRLFNERAYGEFADPRITYNEDTEQLDILVAHTRQPDGSYCELPDYAHVLVVPNSTSGWPALAGIRQHLLVMSGIESGGVVELEYKVTSKPGARPFLAGDVRLDHRYPVGDRKITVTAPLETPLRVITTAAPPGALTGSGSHYECHVKDLPAAPDEPQAPPWQSRCPRLIFSTAGKASDWLKVRLGQIDAAADSWDFVAELAADWTKDAPDDTAKLRALQEKLAATFNFLDLPVEWRPAGPRPAAVVLYTNYGLPNEAAAALLALARAAGLKVLGGILVRDELWNHEVPQDGAVAAYVVLLQPGQGSRAEVASSGEGGDHQPVLVSGDYPEVWDPHHGRVLRDSRWAGCTLLPVPDVLLPRVSLARWTAADESRCCVTGKVTLGEDGNFTGTLSLHTTGLFTAAESLRTSDAQKSRLAALLGRVLPDLNIENFVVKTLAAGEFEAAAQVKSSKPLTKLQDRFMLLLAQDGPFLADVPLPLAYSRRELPVRLTGAFTEDVELTVEWPEKWRLEDPLSVPQIRGDWGNVSQTTATDKNTARLRRHTQVLRPELAPEDFQAFRTALSQVRGEPARLLLVKPESAKAPVAAK
jgi:hypothetical protein